MKVKNWASEAPAIREFRREIYLALKQASYDYERMQYNTVVSACMKMLNTLEDGIGGAGVTSVNGLRPDSLASSQSRRQLDLGAPDMRHQHADPLRAS